MSSPHILLITTDQQRHDALGINGNRILQTPNLDRMAATGVNFTRAYTTTPSCIAARRTILTGQHGATHGLPTYRDGTEFDPPFTLPGILGDLGYQTQLVGKFHQYPQGKRYGFDNIVLSETPSYRPESNFFARNDYVDWLRDRGIDDDPAAHGISGNGRVARPFHLDERYHQTSWVAEESVRFLTRKRDPACPWFLHVSFWAPHPPLVPPQAYFDRYITTDYKASIGDWVPKFDEVPPGIATDSYRGPFTEVDIQRAMAGYYGLIDHIDDRISYLLTRVFAYTSLSDAPVWILFASDHGELLGDHHLFRKALPYEGSAHVPLFVTSRNIGLAPASSDALVCLEDIMPTLVDLAGGDIPEKVDGYSLAPILRGEKETVRDEIFGEHGGGLANHWTIQGRMKYIWYAKTNEEQLFDLEADPQEMHDLSGSTNRLGPFRRAMTDRLTGRTDYDYDTAKLVPLNGRPPRALWGDDADRSA